MLVGIGTIVTGVFALWLYAAIRPRYGPGPKTAVIAGFAFWFAVSLVQLIVLNAIGVVSARFVAIHLSTELVVVLAATLAGAWLYKEEEENVAASPEEAEND